ncbi:Pescadillo N-terminus-domain-containing protein [Radiomyces spectabilis]|uniref:Pescadillo N-terminus-domain-containing protein n=1 Tax=Radiomyces spectabilis TaxID=64574 RepID=UPI00221E8362|nr:Pescadillo N-terminus-domain-containing protein [Radiomyces spectabilis]KAI8391429.1 Pescadillo N-terminus-domain-containing protein [Radiomyces spectabilis]
MGKIIKKGVKGAASNYITRQQALNKLQVSLADFRRLCILKGIYPREPKNKKKANKGSTAPVTFYYAKDIQYLMHEPLIAKFREYKTFARRLNKVLHKGEYSIARTLEKNKPLFTLDHIVKERYPSFIDALRDLDDALSMLFLFSKMPADNKIKAQAVKDCQQLIAEFQMYVMKSKSLRKVFFSIKGIYYQAEIKGQTITWIVPYQFAQTVPTDVDFRVMLTFLDFYRTLVGFVNFRLFNELNMTYPPKIEDGATFNLDEAISASTATNTAVDADEADTGLDEFKPVNDDEEEDENTVTLRKIQEASNETNVLQTLFSNCKFFLSRETPRYALEFMIRSCGGQVSWDPTVGANPPYPETDETITHQICDRPAVSNRVLSRAYIQPQWIADCINARRILREKLYEPGKILPPHLSPFVEAKEGEYVPGAVEEESEEEAEQVSEDKENENEEAEPEATAETVAKAEGTEEDEYEAQLKAEAEGVTFSEYSEADAAKAANKPASKKKRTAADIEEEERKEMAHVMMTNKQRKLYKKMQYGKQKKEEEVAKLERKKKALKSKK